LKNIKVSKETKEIYMVSYLGCLEHRQYIDVRICFKLKHGDNHLFKVVTLDLNSILYSSLSFLLTLSNGVRDRVVKAVKFKPLTPSPRWNRIRRLTLDSFKQVSYKASLQNVAGCTHLAVCA
jgi:hypothetical protein